MKRLALSLLGGFLLPFLYTMIVGPLSPYITNRSVNFWAAAPVRWPIILLLEFQLFHFESDWSLFLYIIGCNVIFYGSLIYFVLFALSKRKKTISLPPAPDHVWTNTEPNS